MIRLEEADGNASLLRTMPDGGNRGEPGDAWGALEPGRFTHATEPTTSLYSGAPSGVRFYEIVLDGDVARLTVSRIPFPVNKLLAGFLVYADVSLTGDEQRQFDTAGNGNGGYDVGDLRQFLKPYMESR